MDVKIREFFDSVGCFFTGGDHIPWCDRDIIAGCEREVTESRSAETKNECLMRLSWALVHSTLPEGVNRGIAMLEASLNNAASPLQTREKLYLLAVGFYRNGDYSRSRLLLEQSLEKPLS
ncbi:mitochondrial fission 1 protein A-like [Curcuma longa]|uniref:mitochondrial fission 1 protein A-like n=1 Tax=Curcuma longa TaxID=136217 RepID=UPI003D9F4F8A